jgi:hypothetical protein
MRKQRELGKGFLEPPIPIIISHVEPLASAFKWHPLAKPKRAKGTKRPI